MAEKEICGIMQSKIHVISGRPINICYQVSTKRVVSGRATTRDWPRNGGLRSDIWSQLDWKNPHLGGIFWPDKWYQAEQGKKYVLSGRARNMVFLAEH